MAAAGKRRSNKETEEVCMRVHAAIQGGMMQSEALKKYDVRDGVYKRWLKKGGGVDVSNFMPRPTGHKGVKREPREVDLSSMGSVAGRLAQIEARLATFESLITERDALKQALRKLLK